MISRVYSGAIVGIHGEVVTVELAATPGLPEFSALGSNDPILKESRHRVSSALRHIGVNLPPRRIIVNLAPAGLPKKGTAFDLSIAVALLQSGGYVDDLSTKGTLFLGELALDGNIRPCRGVLPIGMAALLHGFSTLIVPYENCEDASRLTDMNVYAAKTLKEVFAHLTGENPLRRVPTVSLDDKFNFENNISDVIGQAVAKRGLELSAAGGHHLLMVGPPGCGKSMLAQLIPDILPPMNDVEALEVSSIYSVVGDTRSLTRRRPFRAPHHQTTPIGLTGGGIIPRPGEVTLAHRGVLFLDEFPEFSRAALESLREPLSTGLVTVSRSGGRETFPAQCLLVAAMNPCPCGYYGVDDLRCRCSLPEIMRYQQRVSGPILDRFSLRVIMSTTESSKITYPDSNETTESLYTRIINARNIAEQRQGKTNEELSHHQLVDMVLKDSRIRSLLAEISTRHGLTYRAIDSITKVALTMADLDKRDIVEEDDLLEALSYQRDIRACR